LIFLVQNNQIKLTFAPEKITKNKLQIMKKLFCILMLFVLSFNNGYSQKALSSDYSFKVSEPYKVFDAKDKLYFSKGNEVMSLKFDK